MQYLFNAQIQWNLPQIIIMWVWRAHLQSHGGGWVQTPTCFQDLSCTCDDSTGTESVFLSSVWCKLQSFFCFSLVCVETIVFSVTLSVFPHLIYLHVDYPASELTRNQEGESSSFGSDSMLYLSRRPRLQCSLPMKPYPVHYHQFIHQCQHIILIARAYKK